MWLSDQTRSTMLWSHRRSTKLAQATEKKSTSWTLRWVALYAGYPAWEQAASHVLYCLTSCVHDHMLVYIRESKTPKEAWGNLKKIFAANMATRKLQLRQELNNMQQRDMSITGYTLKIKELCDALGSINVIIDNDEMVQICLGDLSPRFGLIRSAIIARENSPSFFDLQSILLVEENHARQRSNALNG